jgi:DNA-binding response OmpR family regulator
MKRKLEPASANLVRQPAPDKTQPNVSKRILLADDDSGVRESLAAALRSEGYIVSLARDGQQAIEMASTTEVDLILLDLNMPTKNGWDTFEQLTRDDPLLPIIIITARPNQVFMAVGAGVGALLEKPLDIPILLQTVHRLLEEPAEARLARLAGQHSGIFYSPTGGR